MDTKLEILSKPILSPTISLDEGFETDPDRISTDSSELTAQTPAFDLLQRTDRDGVQHSQISRRNQENVSSNSGPSSILCLESEIDSENDKLLIPRAAQKNQSRTEPSAQQTKSSEINRKDIYRRIKTKAPLPPNISSIDDSKINHIYQPIQPRCRSLSVDRIRFNGNNNINPMQNSASSNTNQNILSGRFVRITVDPKQHYSNYHKNYSKTFHQNKYYHSTTNNNRILPIATTGSTSNLYKIYHHSSSNGNNSPNNSITLHQLSSISTASLSATVGSINLNHNNSNMHNNLVPIQYGLALSNKNYLQHHQYGNHVPHQLPVCWTQSIPRQSRK